MKFEQLLEMYLVNLSELCRRGGVTRSRIDDWKRGKGRLNEKERSSIKDVLKQCLGLDVEIRQHRFYDPKTER